MTDHHETETFAQDAVAVIECETLFEGLRFPSGDLMTIELSKPRKAYAVVRRIGDEVHVMALHSDRDTAVRHAKEIVGMINEEGQRKPGGPVQ